MAESWRNREIVVDTQGWRTRCAPCPPALESLGIAIANAVDVDTGAVRSREGRRRSCDGGVEKAGRRGGEQGTNKQQAAGCAHLWAPTSEGASARGASWSKNSRWMSA